MDKNKYYRRIPKIDVLLEWNEIKSLLSQHGKKIVLMAIQKEVSELRRIIGMASDESQIEQKINSLATDIRERATLFSSTHIKRVINATGTVLHTNLGRAPISEKHANQLYEVVTGYSNLEYNLDTGERGERYSHFESYLCSLTGAEAAIAVNNNAAAVLLLLSALTSHKEVLVSRGELIEIGGKFRIPDVMKQSASLLVEVGTTNKTHIEDFESAITAETAAILKVHTSNYKIIGFTESVKRSELSDLCKKKGLMFFEDLGSGILLDLQQYGLSHETTVQETLKQGVDLVCFSGDKLLGGPQAGIIAGKEKLITELKKHPLMRALRIDKFTSANLEYVFHTYLYHDNPETEIPVLKFLKRSKDEIEINAEILYKMLETVFDFAEIKLVDEISQVGGGSLPGEYLPTKCISINPYYISLTKFEKLMRQQTLPVIARLSDRQLLLDLRTVFDYDLPKLGDAIISILLSSPIGKSM